MTRLESAVDDVRSLGIGDYLRGISQPDETVLDRLAVDARRREIGRQREVVNEYRLALQAVGLRTADVDGARGLGARGTRRIDSRLLVGFLDDGGRRPIDRPRCHRRRGCPACRDRLPWLGCAARATS